MRQFRFVHVGVASALAVAALVSVAVFQEVRAATPSAPSSFVPMVPCRLADTRPGDDHVGVHPSALGPGETVVFAVRGTNGNCTIPASATGIASNVTAVNPSAASYLTLYPSDAPSRPLASNVNWTPTSPPTPNQVTVGLSATGSISVYNLDGQIDVVIDIVGYYEPATSGPAGPPGPVGPVGPAGDPGIISDKRLIPSASWSTSTTTLWFTYTTNVSNGWPARYATIVVPELTQAILDSGSIDVRFRPENAAQAWSPLPYSQPSGNGYSRQIEYRASVGKIDFYYSYVKTDIAATLPILANATLPNVEVQWSLRPG